MADISDLLKKRKKLVANLCILGVVFYLLGMKQVLGQTIHNIYIVFLMGIIFYIINFQLVGWDEIEKAKTPPQKKERKVEPIEEEFEKIR